jgi:membrane protease YdiL (CAAX protease family)
LKLTSPSDPMARAAMAYAVGAIICLLLLGRLETPALYFGADEAATILLGKDLVTSLILGLAVGGALALISELFTRFTKWGRSILRVLRRVIGVLHPADVLLLALVSSFAEELIFRGLLMPYTGLWWSAFIFGIAHLVPRKGLWPWSLWALGAGLALGWLAQATGGLLAPFAAHFVVNSIGLAALGRKSL